MARSSSASSWIVGQGAAADLDLPAMGAQDPGENLHGRRLAGAIGPEETQNLATPQGDIDRMEGLVPTVKTVQSACRQQDLFDHGPYYWRGHSLCQERHAIANTCCRCPRRRNPVKPNKDEADYSLKPPWD